MRLATAARRLLGLDALRDPSWVPPQPGGTITPDTATPGPAEPEPAGADSASTATARHAAESDAGGTSVTTLDLTVLLVAAAADEPSHLAWRLLLEREGVPYETLLAGRDPLTTAALTAGDGHGRFQAVVLSTDGVLSVRGGVSPHTLSDEECQVLQEYRHRFGVRQITAYAVPGPAIGMAADCWGGDVSGSGAEVTPAGQEVFPELVGPVPLSEGTYGYRSTPLPDAAFTVLVQDEVGASVVGVVGHGDEDDEMVMTVASGPYSRHMHLLGHGMLSWVTRGVRLGRRGFFLNMQVDDILLGAPVPVGADPVRMTGDDVVACSDWSAAHGVRLDMAYNAWGSVSATADGSADELTGFLLERTTDFNWLNHTFGHLDLDDASASQIRDEITRNIEWAAEHWVPVELDVLVTGAHTGLENPALADTAYRCGIRWLASDASREPEPRRLGAVRTIPRHPVNIPLDITTAQQWAGSPDDGSDSWRDRAEQMLSAEAELVLGHVLSGDPRPHYSHQNALIGDRLLLLLLSRVTAYFRELVREPLVQLSMADIGRELERMRAWQAAMAQGMITAVQSGRSITVTNRSDRDTYIPFTADRNDAGSEHPGWVLVAARSQVTV